MISPHNSGQVLVVAPKDERWTENWNYKLFGQEYL